MARSEHTKQPAVVAHVGAEPAINNRFVNKCADVSVVNALLVEALMQFVDAVNRTDQVDDGFFESTGKSDEELLFLVSQLMIKAAEPNGQSLMRTLAKLEPYFATVPMGNDMQHIMIQYPAANKPRPI